MTIDTEGHAKEEKRSYWQEKVSAWETSGLRQAEFCRRHGLKARKFGYWKRRLHQAAEPVAFVPLRIKSPHTYGSPLGLVLEGGFRIEVGEGFNPPALKQLILTLRQL